MKHLYRVNVMLSSMSHCIHGIDVRTSLSLTDGMVGMSPVFSSKRAAQKYVNTFPKESRPEIIRVTRD